MKNFIMLCFFFLANVIFSQKNDIIKYGNLLDFKVPEKYELRTNIFYNDVKSGFQKKLDIDSSEAKYILQPIGMNDMEKKTSTYSRILIDVEYGDFDLNPNIINYSRSDLNIIDEDVKNYLDYMKSEIPAISILEITPIQVKKINYKNFLVYTYTRKMGDNPNVKVVTYTCFNKSYLIRITISYRINEQNYWQSSIQYFLDNINIKN